MTMLLYPSSLKKHSYDDATVLIRSISLVRMLAPQQVLVVKGSASTILLLKVLLTSCVRAELQIFWDDLVPSTSPEVLISHMVEAPCVRICSGWQHSSLVSWIV